MQTLLIYRILHLIDCVEKVFWLLCMPGFLQSTSMGAKEEPRVAVSFKIDNLNIELPRRPIRQVCEGVPTLGREVGKPALKMHRVALFLGLDLWT